MGGLHCHRVMVLLMHCFIALHEERFPPRSLQALELEPILQGSGSVVWLWHNRCPYCGHDPP